MPARIPRTRRDEPRPAAAAADARPLRRAYRAAGREQQKHETRARVLDRAITLFSERGFDGASVRDIGAAAGVSHAAIRLHFGSKEKLWRAAIDRLFERQRQEIGWDEGQDFSPLEPEQARAATHRYVRYCARHPEHVRLMVQESLRDSERVRWLARAHVRRVQAPFVRAFEQARRKGLPQALPIPSMLYGLIAASQMVFALAAEVKHVYGLDVSLPQFVEAHAETVFRMALGAGAPAAPPTRQGPSPRAASTRGRRRPRPR